MKRLFSILIMLLFMSGCSVSKNNLPLETDRVEKGENNSSVVKESASPTVKAEKREASGKKTEEFFLWCDLDYDIGERLLIFTNLQDEKIIKNISVGKRERIVGTYKVENGFVVVKMKLKKNDNVDNQSDGVAFSFQISEEDVTKYELIFYDKQLNERKKLDILDLFPKTHKESIINESPIINKTGDIMAWNVDNYIVCFEFKTKKIRKYDELLRHDISIDMGVIKFVGNNKIGFTGWKDEDGCYGYFNISSGELKSFIENDYDMSDLYTNARFLCINDGQDPYTQSSSGRILILNCITNERCSFDVDGIESTMSTVTEDGKYVIAVKRPSDEEFRVRLYDFQTGKKLDEKIVYNSAPEGIGQFGDTYAVIYATETKKGVAYEIGIE